MLLRPGNTESNTATDHIAVIKTALAQHGAGGPEGHQGLGRWCFSRVANTPDVIALGHWWQRILFSFLRVRDDVGFDSEAG